MKHVCHYCKHRKPKHICGNSQSPFYSQKIEWNETTCNYFEHNPATHWANGVAKHIQLYNNDTLSPDDIFRIILEGNQELESSLNLGLPEDDEIEVLSSLADGYNMLAKLESDSPNLQNKHWQISLRYIERAIELDLKGQYGYFSDVINVKRLQEYDAIYALQFSAIKQEQGIDGAIQYGESKMRLYNQLPINPLLNLVLGVGTSYGKKGELQTAKKYFQQILNTDSISPDNDDTMSGWETDVRVKARKNLQIAEEHLKEKTGGCYIATACYGAYDAPEVVILRQYRDEVLSKSLWGRYFIQLYYRYSPYFAQKLKSQSTITAIIKKYILARIVNAISNE